MAYAFHWTWFTLLITEQERRFFCGREEPDYTNYNTSKLVGKNRRWKADIFYSIFPLDYHNSQTLIDKCLKNGK